MDKVDTSKVRRYWVICERLVYASDGQHVAYSDYADLHADLQAARGEIVRLRSDRDDKSKRMWGLGHECDRLEADLQATREKIAAAPQFAKVVDDGSTCWYCGKPLSAHAVVMDRMRVKVSCPMQATAPSQEK